MDMLTQVLLVLVVLLLGIMALLIILRRSDSPARLAKLSAVNATLQSNLDNLQRNLSHLQDQLEPFGRLRDECTGLKQSLAAARDLNQKIESEKGTWKRNYDALQLQVRELTADKTALAAKLEHTQKQLGERDALEQRFKDSFRSLAAETLKAQGENFQSSADALLRSRQEAIDKIVRPLTEKINTLSHDNTANASKFEEQIKKMIEESRYWGREAQALKSALSRPGVRGRWGEIQLERVLELSGLRKGIDYSDQDSFETDEGQRLRPDIIVQMPEERRIILDSKVSLAALMEAFETDDEGGKAQAFNRHVEQIKNHVKELSGKEYWQLLNTTDLVVMVLPEFAFLPALERDTDLIEWALNKKVIIVTPPTLLALLKAIALTWKQVRVVEKAREISELGKELHDRLAVFAEHYVAMGRSLHQTVERYNKSTNSWDSRVMTKAAIFKDLEVPITKQQPELQALDTLPSMINKIPDPNSN